MYIQRLFLSLSLSLGIRYSRECLSITYTASRTATPPFLTPQARTRASPVTRTYAEAFIFFIFLSLFLFFFLLFLFANAFLSRANAFVSGNSRCWRCCGKRKEQTQARLRQSSVSIRPHASAYVSIRQHTAAYVSIRRSARCVQTPLVPL